MDEEGLMHFRSESSDKGGTMRLGSQLCKLKKDSKMAKLYKKLEIFERHRHRYEFNNNYLSKFDKSGLKIIGRSEDESLVEAVELKGHKWLIG